MKYFSIIMSASSAALSSPQWPYGYYTLVRFVVDGGVCSNGLWLLAE
jgi:hypothetical protein